VQGAFPRLEARLKEAERAAERKRQEAADAEARAARLKGQLPVWQQLCDEERSDSLGSLQLTSSLREKLSDAGISTLSSLVRFWLNATWQEKTAIPGVGHAAARKVGIALTWAFNAHAPAHLRNPEIPSYNSETHADW